MKELPRLSDIIVIGNRYYPVALRPEYNDPRDSGKRRYEHYLDADMRQINFSTRAAAARYLRQRAQEEED